MFSTQTLFRVSKWLHKYVGLSFLLVFLFVAVTGIFLNHPALLSGLSVPASWLGKSYQYANWNRFTFRDALVFESGAMLVGGKMGIWYSSGPGAAFQEMNEGLSDSFYLQDINCLLAVESGQNLRFYAGGRNGLYVRDERGAKWQAVPKLAGIPIVDLVQTSGQVMAFSPYGCFTSTVVAEEILVQAVPLKLDSSTVRVPGFRLFFELHSGKLFGLPGRLVVDCVALILIFLSLTALYVWYVPWRRKRMRKRTRKTSRWFAKLYGYHLHVGIWGGLFLFIIGVSGALIRPPLIVLANMASIPYEAFFFKPPEILRATLSDADTLIVATRDGWFRGNADLSSPLTEVTPPLPVFGMGTTVLDTLGEGTLLVGSFSGLYVWNLTKNVAFDLQGKEAPAKAELRPAELMAAAAMVSEGVLTGYVDYKKGLQTPGNSPILDRPFPLERSVTRTSLYHFLFELHNGRFLRDFVGVWYILFVPLVGLGLMLVVATGTFDWLKRKKIVGAARKK